MNITPLLVQDKKIFLHENTMKLIARNANIIALPFSSFYPTKYHSSLELSALVPTNKQKIQPFYTFIPFSFQQFTKQKNTQPLFRKNKNEQEFE